ncbi:MAG: Homoserine kinase [Gemmatimonadaceae bacterium]|nr:Homoserine kinase [Gemmatimonadaceae bacterium]
MKHSSPVAAIAPPSIGNFGPGLDVVGCAVAGSPDLVTAEWDAARVGVTVVEPGHPDLPTDPAEHASAIAASAVLDVAASSGRGQFYPGGVVLRIRKGLPLAAGQGGSAASAVAGAVAANALIGGLLTESELLACALKAESRVAGAHLDNIAPSLLGGFVLVRSLDPIDVIRLPSPDELFIVLAQPHQQLRTAEARAVLPSQVPRDLAVHQLAQVGAMVAALYTNDLELLGRSIDDRIAEPARAPLLPGFTAAKRAAVSAGALGVSISGAGPTSFAIVPSLDVGRRVAKAMEDTYALSGVATTVRVTRPGPGARVVDPDLPLVVEP